MVVDTSALCAILFGEPDRKLFLDTLLQSRVRCMSACTVLEVSIVVMRRSGSDAEARAQRLKHDRHEIGQQRNEEQRVAELGAAREVGGPVAGIDEADRHQKPRPEKSEKLFERNSPGSHHLRK